MTGGVQANGLRLGRLVGHYKKSSAHAVMLYQGGPAEGGQASEYSLTLPDQEKADAVAWAFRRVIELCAGKTPSGK